MTYKKDIKTNLGKINPKKSNSKKASSGKTSSRKASSERIRSKKVSSKRANSRKATPERAKSKMDNKTKEDSMTYKKDIKTNLGKINSKNSKSKKASSGKASSKKVSSRKANQKKKKVKVNLTQDAVFKHFFSTSDDVLKKMLESFLPKLSPISGVKVINSELQSEDPANKEAKTFFLDLVVELSTGDKVNIEMQNIQELGFVTRVVGYMARMFLQGFKRGKDYKEVKATYSIVFLSEPIEELEEVLDYVSHCALARIKPPQVVVCDKLNLLFVELSKLPMEDIEKLDRVGKWCYFIKRSGELSVDEKKSLSKEEEIKMAIKHLDSLSKDERFIYEFQLDKAKESRARALMYSKKQGLEEGREEGINIGIGKGREEEKKTLIANFYKQGVAISNIAKAVVWSEADVLKLIQELGLKE